MSDRITTGPVAAMMDELERATRELTAILETLGDDEFLLVCDPEAQDPDCVSIATIVAHVARSGCGYADYFRSAFGTEPARPAMDLATRAGCIQALAAMNAYMAATLEGHWTMTDEEGTAIAITVRWGPVFNFEPLFEHAIVHVLRHRRQIERFLAPA